MPVFESPRKVQEFGSSLAITLPAMFVKANEIEKGCTATTIYGLNGVLVASWEKDTAKLRKHIIKMLNELDAKTSMRK